MSETKKGLWERLTSKVGGQNDTNAPEEMSFKRLDRATKIEVQTNLNQRVKTIEDAPTIQAVLNFLQTQRDGWNTPKYSAPVTNLRLAFYNGTQSLGQLGFGQAILVTTQSGSPYLKRIGPHEYARLEAILKLNEEKIGL